MSPTMPTRAEVLSALSYALDLVEGQERGHAGRTCLLAMRLAEALALPPYDRQQLYYAALLKDSGCSSNSARIHKIFGGDELLAKRAVKMVDWSRTFEALKFGVAHTEPGGSLAQRLRRMLANLGPPKKVMDEVTAARCHRGAAVAAGLGLGHEAAAAIRFLDEHWDGNGSPTGLAGEKIPLLARVLCLAQTLEVFAWSFGPHQAFDLLKRRRGTWFDPAVFDTALKIENDTEFWARLHASGHAEAAAAADPEWGDGALAPQNVDRVCEVFAQIVDAKSSFTQSHSDRVTEYAVLVCRDLQAGCPHEMRRAAQLHDLGKLGVPNSILDKPGKLTDEEFERVRRHPRDSEEILRQIPGFQRLADLAGAHHERLDGRGYWRGRGAGELDLQMRILSGCDVFDALTAERPYRGPMDPADALTVMERERGEAFDPVCLDALRQRFVAGTVRLPSSPIRRAA